MSGRMTVQIAVAVRERESYIIREPRDRLHVLIHLPDHSHERERETASEGGRERTCNLII